MKANLFLDLHADEMRTPPEPALCFTGGVGVKYKQPFIQMENRDTRLATVAQQIVSNGKLWLFVKNSFIH